MLKNEQPPVVCAVGAGSSPVPNGTPHNKPLRPAVIGFRFLRSQYWSNIFVKPISLSRSGRQTADYFVHRATRSKMAGFKTTTLHWGYGLGRFFGFDWGLLTFEHIPGLVKINDTRRCTSSFGHGFSDWAR